MKIIFLRPGVENEALNEIISVINNSERIIRVAVAYFTHPQIATALMNRNKQGRRTHFLLNTSDIIRPVGASSEIVVSKELMNVINEADYNTELKIKSLGLRSRGRYQNMHHKFMVSDDVVIFGSVNWTTAALHGNYECLIKTSDIELIGKFIEEFDEIWNHAQELYTDKGQIRRIMCPLCEDSEGVDFESYGPICTYCGHKFNLV